MNPRPRPVPRARETLSTPTLALALLAVVPVCLVLLFPGSLRELALRDARPGAVTRTVLQVLLERAPEDLEVRLSLVRQFVEAGELTSAADLLGPARRLTRSDSRVSAVVLEVASIRWRAAPVGSLARAHLRTDLLEELTFGKGAWPDCVGLALELGRPDLAVDPLLELALAPGALTLPEGLQTACGAATGPTCAALLALKDAAAAEAPSSHRRVLARLVPFARDDEVLRAADQLAHAHGDVGAARSWWKRRIVDRPEDRAARRHLRDDLLELGETGAAYEIAATLAPEDAHEATENARLAEWSGHAQAAADLWTRLAMRGNANALDRAVTLSTQLGHVHALGRLLEAKARRTGLTQEDREAFVRVVRATLDPEEGVIALERLAAIGGNSAEIAEETAVLLWRLGRRREALRELADARAAAIEVGASHWQLVADLAWQEERDEDARLAFGSLFDLGGLRPGDGDRWITLEEHTRPNAAGPLAARIWRDRGEDRLLLRALELALRSGQWDDLRSLVDEALDRGRAPDDSPAWWEIRGELAIHDERWRDAFEAFDRAAQLAPSSELLRRMAWLSFQPELRDRVAGSLERLASRGTDGLDALPLLLAQASKFAAEDRNELARQVQRRALALLHTRAQEGPLPADLAIAHVTLLTALLGAPAASPWLRHALEAPGRDPELVRFAQRWLIAQGRYSEARALAARAPSVEPSTELALALEEGDRPRALGLARSTAVSEGERARALHRLGEYDDARDQYGHAQALATPREAVAISRDLAWLPPTTLRASAAYEFAAGPTDRFDLLHGRVEQPTRFGRVRVDASAGQARRAATTASTAALSVVADRESRSRQTTVGVSLDWRGDPGASPIPGLRVLHRETPLRSLSFSAGATWRDSATLPPALRSTALRDDVNARVRWRLRPTTDLQLGLEGQRWVTRQGVPIAAGMASDGALEQELPVGSTLALRARLTGSATSLSHDPSTAAGLPLRVGAIGAGVTFSSGGLDDDRPALRFLADAWVGWLLPVNRAATQLRAGLAVRVLPQTDLVIDAWRADNQAWLGATSLKGCEVRVSHRLGR